MTAGTNIWSSLGGITGTLVIPAGSQVGTVQNPIVSANSLVQPTLQTVDDTAKSVVAVCSSGLITFTLNAVATADVTVAYSVTAA